MELCTAAFAANYEVVENIPEKILLSPSGFEMCLSAARQDGFILKFLPRKISQHPRVNELYMAAVTQNGAAINYVGNLYYTRELTLAAVRQNGFVIDILNMTWLNRQVCLAAVTQNGLVLRSVPYIFKDLEMCKTAVAQNPAARVYIPEYILDMMEGTILNPVIVPLPEGLDITGMEDPVGLESLSEMKDTVYGFVEHAPGKYAPAGTLEMFRDLISNKMFKCTRCVLFVAQFNRTEPIDKFVWCTLP
jgi:hypothetical protein